MFECVLMSYLTDTSFLLCKFKLKLKKAKVSEDILTCGTLWPPLGEGGIHESYIRKGLISHIQ
jgi:hypothetical protein